MLGLKLGFGLGDSNIDGYSGQKCIPVMMKSCGASTTDHWMVCEYIAPMRTWGIRTWVVADGASGKSRRTWKSIIRRVPCGVVLLGGECWTTQSGVDVPRELLAKLSQLGL